MCNFFSCNSDGHGSMYYLNAAQRKETKGRYESSDSHTSIADFYGVREDNCNKYEYNPLTRVFTIDQINNTDDSILIKEQCEALDFKTIVPELIIKPIINPFVDRQCEIVTKEDIELLREWASVGDSVRDSVWEPVWDSVRASVGDSVGASVRASVWDSVQDSVWDSVGASLRDSVWESVQDSVWVYMSSFFDVEYKYDFSSCIKLWETGLIPSYDGKVWRLHGFEGNVLWTGEVEK